VLDEKFQELPVLHVAGVIEIASNGGALEWLPVGTTAYWMKQYALPAGAKVAVEGKR
jgi:hypothetical protein